MQSHVALSGSSKALNFIAVLVVIWSFWPQTAHGFGSMGPIAASLGGDGLFCAIDAGGKQDVLCWGRNASAGPAAATPTSSSPAGAVPAMFALSGGEGFLCGILSNTSQAFCWSYAGAPSPATNLVPVEFRTTAYSSIAAGTSHVCAVRGPYFSDHDSGTVDCWDIVKTPNQTLASSPTSLFSEQSIANLAFRTVVAGEGFTCGDPRDDAGGLICWGPRSASLQISNSSSESHTFLASSRASLCSISELSRKISCWGETDWPVGPPSQTRFVALSAGSRHFCGIREDNHGVECWGFFNSSSVPRGSGFKALASSELTTCGIREDDLVLDCWANSNVSSSIYDPPLELCVPGICTSRPCRSGEFEFNASVLNEPDLTNLCVRKDLKICSPCGTSCADGFFLSSPCTGDADRVCTACSLCQNSSCGASCGLRPEPEARRLWLRLRRAVLIGGGAVSGLVLVVALGCVAARFVGTETRRRKQRRSKQFNSCIGKAEIENEASSDYSNSVQSAIAPCPGAAQVFRLSELKDATNGFKEFNELGRGSYGFVYKAVLADGRQVAVKRANAATIIHSNSRDFEMELEILCKIRHCNIVNLLGYCSEMGERLLVYEYMPHGTLYDHLHGGLSPLNWSLRLKVAMQAAKGLEYLHKEFVPPIVHRDVKTSNILLDSEWCGRISDFGLISSSDKDLSGDLATDVYGFGIVLLEVLSGRKALDRDFDPPSLIEWARPLIKQGKAAAIIDRYVALPRNVEPLLKLVDIAELATRENASQRPSISDMANSLEQIVKEGLML